VTPAEPKRNPWSRVFHADEVFQFQGNTCEEIGLTMRLRWYAAAHNGIPATEDALIRIAKQSGLTRNRFIKLWSILSEKFTEIDGLLFYIGDDERRKEAEVESAKSREAGKKGAEIRWKDRRQKLTVVPESPIAPPFFQDSHHYHYQSQVETLEGGGPLLPPNPPEEVVDPTPQAEDQPQEFALTAPLSDQEYQEFAIHSASVGLGVPSRKLCERIRVKFHAKYPDMPVSEIVKSLPKFERQKTAGLWETLDIDQLQLQALNQHLARDIPRKPNSSQDLERKLAMARERSAQ